MEVAVVAPARWMPQVKHTNWVTSRSAEAMCKAWIVCVREPASSVLCTRAIVAEFAGSNMMR